MTPRSELFIKIKEALSGLPFFELIDWNKGQFDNPENSLYGTIYTAALISVDGIEWGNRSGEVKEGTATITITLHTKDGYQNQFEGVDDPHEGLSEIYLIDQTTTALEFLTGEYFKPLQLTNEGGLPTTEGDFAYTLTYETTCFNQLPKRYVFNRL
ncbi:MAG: hypothetical protein C4K58_06880 [Flavobacteriaceae bacterium]|nr:MAG: hypothetical protein C4K58_06880 [Flavobacteriaceae bacterium]